MSLDRLRGVIPPVPTMFNEDGSFDPLGMGVLIDRLLASDIDGFLFLGSAGEFAQLSHAARREIAQFCVSRVAGRRLHPNVLEVAGAPEFAVGHAVQGDPAGKTQIPLPGRARGRAGHVHALHPPRHH